ncbi:stage V sporulation protein T [Lysinibacillus sphaericus]|uniref:Stage V sporulation protein T n=3 Tax=Lysinibacillus TaxID=400634 RepID=A0A2S5CTV6_LYSSH|nr:MULTISPECIES: stage V sporulation protein T [Lysinibacillus]QPQ33634.1 stage V sporulation protein T [Lysinibacillus sp. JNUCC-52]AHN20111.1 AbrB family transcriptional regulator [Lysinibacillus varians]AVK98914.1 stage V sporulation protein T [Lysinibacillus sphaericus]MCS1384590.1 stage V sporulation protein T [Lysinibacillus sphaericus]MED4545220.1 stage V sporulation protein T [Lysinibacillus sphaericus]
MKATGIVRRIDDLGRVVIPKEIRRTLRIREGDPLEIYTDREGEIILKKYSPINDLGEFAREYVETLYETLGTPAFVTDRDEVIAVAGIGKKEYINRRITSFAEGFMDERSTKIEKMETTIEIVPGQYEQVKSYCATPIMVNGDPIGCIIVLSKVHFVGEVEVKVVETAANFLSKQMNN